MRTVSVSAVVPHGTIAVGRGIDERGHCVEFAGEWRPMRGIAEVIRDTGEPVETQVEDWAIIRDSGPAFEFVS